MKTFNLSEISTTKRTEILNEARENGAVLQKKNTNGEVLEEFVMYSYGNKLTKSYKLESKTNLLYAEELMKDL